MNPKARQRAELIFQVRSGQMTASQAAKTLGISRQAYYQWERRALQALMRAVEDQPSGRPKSPIDPEKQKLNDRVKQLEQQVLQYEQRDQLRQILSHWTEREDLPPSKKNPK
jgi:predicted ArsR family transcriptional regulator